MVDYLILKFNTIEEANAALVVINNIFFELNQEHNLDYENGIIGLNAMTGEPMNSSVKTMMWSSVVETNGIYWFPSLSNKPEFVDWRNHIPEGVVIPDDEVLT